MPCKLHKSKLASAHRKTLPSLGTQLQIAAQTWQTDLRTLATRLGRKALHGPPPARDEERAVVSETVGGGRIWDHSCKAPMEAAAPHNVTPHRQMIS